MNIELAEVNEECLSQTGGFKEWVQYGSEQTRFLANTSVLDRCER